MDKLLKQHPYYDRSRIGANLYPGQTSGVNTFAVTAELVALASLPESEVRTLRDVLERAAQAVHPTASGTDHPHLGGMQAGSIALLHPGMLDAAHPPGGHPHGHPVPGRHRAPLADLVPGEQRGHTDRWDRLAGRHRATGGSEPCRSSRRRDPLNQFGAASTNQARHLTDPPPGSALAQAIP